MNLSLKKNSPGESKKGNDMISKKMKEDSKSPSTTPELPKKFMKDEEDFQESKKVFDISQEEGLSGSRFHIKKSQKGSRHSEGQKVNL